MRALLLLLAIALAFTSCRDERERVEQRPASPLATSAPRAAVVSQGGEDVRAVALVFEPGDDEARTEDILRALREKRVRATFAVTGVWGEEHRETLFSISSEGHQIINGTYDGRSWTGASTGEAALTAGERKLALSRAEVTVYRYTSQSTMPYFYPPHGDFDDSVLRDAGANGYDSVVVPAVSLETSAPSEILAGTRSGAIIGFPPDPDVAILSAIIDGLAGEGYGFITIKEMTP